MKRFENILVIGAGSFGSSATRRLCELGVKVTVADKVEQRLEEVKEWAVETIVTDVMDKEALGEITRRDFDAAIIAVGTSFSTILILTVYLRDLGIPFIVGRAGNKLQGEILERIGCNMVIMPEDMVGRNLAEQLILGEVMELELDEKHSIMEILAPPAWWGKQIIELNVESKGVVICAVRREELIKKKRARKIIAPIDREFRLIEGDSLVVLGERRTLYRLARGAVRR